MSGELYLFAQPLIIIFIGAHCEAAALPDILVRDKCLHWRFWGGKVHHEAVALAMLHCMIKKCRPKWQLCKITQINVYRILAIHYLLCFKTGDEDCHCRIFCASKPDLEGKSSIASAVATWLVGGNKWLQVRQCHSTALRIVARIFNLLLLWQPHFSCQQPPKCVLARHCWNVGKWCLLSTRTPPTPLNSSP